MLRSLRHPSIVQAEMLHMTTAHVCIVLELCEKGCLQTYVEERGPLSEMAITPLFHQMLEAVDYLHKKRIVHRDLKPDNLLLTGGGAWDKQSSDVPSRLKLTDFNSAKRIGESQSAMLTFRGTRLYSAPELLLGTAWNERVDIWCCGLCLFFAVRGELPFDCLSPNSKMLLFKGSLPDISWQGMSFLMRHLTLQCLAVDMRDRPPAMELLHHSLFQDGAEEAVTGNDGATFSNSFPAAISHGSHVQLRQLQIKKLSRCAPPIASDQIASAAFDVQRGFVPAAVFPDSPIYENADFEMLSENAYPGCQELTGGTADSSDVDAPENVFFTWSCPSRGRSLSSVSGEHQGNASNADDTIAHSS